MKSVAFVTYRKSPHLTEDDELVISPLQKVGIESYVIPWDQEGVAWDSFDAVVVRSTWDYHTRIDEFIQWLNDLDRCRANVWNPLSAIRPNIEKTYLKDLETRGIPIVPTLWIDHSTQSEIQERMDNKLWNEIVIKPTVGASSYEIHKFTRSDQKGIEQKMESLLQKSAVMIQPFINEIQEVGEISLVFFDKKFSHAVLRKPRPGEFRNYGWGMKKIAVDVSDDIIQSAQRVVDTVKSPLLYARVDGVVVEDRFLLMELELIEPVLFFAFDPESPKRFANALKEKI